MEQHDGYSSSGPRTGGSFDSSYSEQTYSAYGHHSEPPPSYNSSSFASEGAHGGGGGGRGGSGGGSGSTTSREFNRSITQAASLDVRRGGRVGG